jgi:hypothetical protein
MRMVGDTRHDRALSIELILDIQKLLEEVLIYCTVVVTMLKLSLHGVFLIGDFCAGLRGEE